MASYLHPNFPAEFKHTDDPIQALLHYRLLDGKSPADIIRTGGRAEEGDDVNPRLVAVANYFLENSSPEYGWDVNKGLGLSKTELESLLKRRKEAFAKFAKSRGK